jgi:hypothetical protein
VQRDRRPEANTSCALRSCGQHHKGISKDRERAAKVNFPETSRIEAKLVPEFDLRDKIPIALALPALVLSARRSWPRR